jgi:hypothetical protein
VPSARSTFDHRARPSSFWGDCDFHHAGDRFLFTRPPRGAIERREIARSLGWAGRLREKLRASKKNRRPERHHHNVVPELKPGESRRDFVDREEHRPLPRRRIGGRGRHG